MEIVGVLDEKGEVKKWEGHVVRLAKAKERLEAEKKPLDKLTTNEIESIVDPKEREVIRKHLETHGGDVKKAFADYTNHPRIKTRSGERYIHRVRIKDILNRVVKRDWGDGKKFQFSVANGDTVELELPESGKSLYSVRSIYPLKQGGRLYHGLRLAPLQDARKLDDIKKDNKIIHALVEPLRKLNCRKVVVSPLGEIRYAND
jgi:hypothetical protein